MTLLELLRQELPKRGGWPEGVDRINQGWDGRLEKYGEDGESYDFGMETIFPLTTDHRVKSKCVHECGANFVTREQYEVTGWDGIGLPPVGMKVEWLSDKYGWLGGTVAAHDAKYPLIAIIRHNDGYTGCHRHELRTEAERAIDEMVRLSGVSIGAAKILYDAGYRKG